MKRILTIGGMVLAVTVFSLNLLAAKGLKLAEGEAEVLYECLEPAPEGAVTPEGIALDRNGNIYLSMRTTDGVAYLKNEIVKITPKGEVSILADLGPALLGLGIVGLTTDSCGNVYAAFASGDANHGVWKIYPDGSAEQLAGSWQLQVPNALTFDNDGNLYVSDFDPLNDSAAGIWKYGPDTGVFEPWCADPLVRALPIDPYGMPLGGANGVAFDPPNNLYVANTEQSIVVHVPIMEDGSAGVVSSITNHPYLVMNPDGVAVDNKGMVYTVIPISTVDVPPDMGGPLPPLSPVIRIDPKTGMIEPLFDPLMDDSAIFDFPTSLAFGSGPLDKKSVYVISMGAVYFNFPPGTGPKLTQVGVGVPGRTGQ